MKRLLQLTLASLVMLIGLLVVTPFVTPVGAINVFSGACDGASGSTTDSTTTTPTDTTTTPADGSTTPATDGTTTDTTAASGGSSSSICGAAKQDDAPAIVKNIINTILFVLGIGAVVMIIIGGVRYTTSNGDSSAVKGAKDTVLYAVVGLIIAIMAFTIVNFVIDRLGK